MYDYSGIVDYARKLVKTSGGCEITALNSMNAWRGHGMSLHVRRGEEWQRNHVVLVQLPSDAPPSLFGLSARILAHISSNLDMELLQRSLWPGELTTQVSETHLPSNTHRPID